MVVDVIINIYGKPWQTLCSLKSLMRHSSKHIDKIYFIEEKDQPYHEEVKWVVGLFDNVIHFVPANRQFQRNMVDLMRIQDDDDRHVVPFQFGIESSDKKYVFICHTDILFTGDIIGNMLDSIDDAAGIGSIGACWNCPCGPDSANVCDGSRFNAFNPSYEQVIAWSDTYPPAREEAFFYFLDRTAIMPLPECRLNEFACIIDREITSIECYPNGNTPFFGCNDGIDCAAGWFRSLRLKGYKFKNYDIGRDMIHGFYADGVAGYPTMLNPDKYAKSEMFAKSYYELNFAGSMSSREST